MANVTFSKITRLTLRASEIASGIFSRLSPAMTMSLLSIAMSVPSVPMAMPTSAAAIAGASFIPSPENATLLPLRVISVIISFLSSGRRAA